jgi:hypothetical protein
MTVDPSPQLTDDQARRFVVDTRPWMSCDECFDHLDEYVESSPDAPFEWLPAMSAHLSGCQVCREEAESLLLLLAEDG